MSPFLRGACVESVARVAVVVRAGGDEAASDFDCFLILFFRICSEDTHLGVLGNDVALRRGFECSHRDGIAVVCHRHRR